MSADLHSRIASELSRRLEVARAVEQIKPGRWLAHATHDGTMWTGHSHVRTEETTSERWISAPVAYQIFDSDLERSSLAAEPPEPGITAAFIASNSPADSIRRYEAYEAILSHARSMFAFEDEEPDNAVVKGSASAYRAVLRFLAASLGLDTEGSPTDG